jgi:hypothetical protein
MMIDQLNIDKFKDLDFDDFRRLAKEPGISQNQRIGFPDSYRNGFTVDILNDICIKLPALAVSNATIVDIGPGCSELSEKLIGICARRQHKLVLVDSTEMLDLLPDASFITKVPGRFPDNIGTLTSLVPEGVDAVLCYSVLHYLLQDFDIESISNSVASLLRKDGRALLGDIPNISKRKRFFSSAEGRAFHRKYTGKDEDPTDLLNESEDGRITDHTLEEFVACFHRHGLAARVVEQGNRLPMANRREDLLIGSPPI